VVPGARTRGSGHKTETQEVLSEHEETLFHFEGDQAQAQVVWRGSGAFCLAGAQKPPRHVSGQLALGGTA